MAGDSYTNASMYIASAFNLLFSLQDQPEYLLFNTLRGSSVLLAADLAKLLISPEFQSQGQYQSYRLFNGRPARISKALASSRLEEQLHELLSLGILYKAEDEEDALLDAFLAEYFRPAALNLTIAHTAACQMNCSYCFQAGRNQNLHHSDSEKLATLAWIESYLSRHSEIESVHLGLFGGEPLTDIAACNYYIDEVSKICRRRNLAFKLRLTSNGLRIDAALLRDWMAKGLDYLRITLDGPPEIHDARRPYLSGSGTFWRIVANLKSISELENLGIGISMNIDSQNAQSVGRMLDILEAEGLKEQIEIILEPVLPTLKELEESRRSESVPASSQPVQKTKELLAQALEQVTLRGFSTPLFPGLCLPCNFVQANNFVIDWEGRLYRCTFTMMDRNFSVGSVENDLNFKNEEFLAARQVVANCRQANCAYLPVCAGSCRYLAWSSSGDFASFNCPLEIWDEVLPMSIAHFFGFRSRIRN